MKGRQLGHSGDTLVTTLKVIAVVFAFLMVLMILIGLISKASKQGFTNNESDNKSMFLFANNKSSPECCNFSYSTSNGCVCIDRDQQELLHTRGGNRTTGDDF
jgi:Na+-transporting methylmalonyl-CoA/oxaloacetate decarboxylase gamma subunit